MDPYWSYPRAPLTRRRARFLEYCAAASPDGDTGFFSQIARLELGVPISGEGPIREGIEFVASRRDCSDFAVAGLLRIAYRYGSGPLVPSTVREAIQDALLGFKYWWDEPDDNRRCYHTENHQILFHSGELLAGQLFPTRRFGNDGRTGREHEAHALHYIRRWFTFRFRFGFSEWLSNCYFNENLLALANLHDFAGRPEIRAQAGLLIDILLFEMALHSFRGVFGSTHGRTYAHLIKGGGNDRSATILKLMLGMGRFNSPKTSGAIALATSSYRCPDLFAAIAADLDTPMLALERHSLNVADASRYGLSLDDPDDGLLFMSIQDYLHPLFFPLYKRMKVATSGQPSVGKDFEAKFQTLFRSQIERYGKIIDPEQDCHALTEVHIQTYRTAAYMLSCAQDYRPGKPGYQQHIWQATLGEEAVLFTNHPGSADETARPNYWAGNGMMPRAAQHQNVLLCIHRIPSRDPFPFSHAYVPRDAFDEWELQGHWFCARKNSGFVALFSQHPCRWVADSVGRMHELRADTPENIWVCELGDRDRWRTLAEFFQAVRSAEIVINGLDVAYRSPTSGWIRFGWRRPLDIGGRRVDLHASPRFANPYCQCPFPASRMIIRRGATVRELDLAQKH